MDQAQTKYWLALNTISGLGITGQRALMQAFKSPEQIFAASIAHMSAVEGIGKTLAGRIHHFKDWQRIEGDLARYQLEQITIIPWHDQSYPELLSHIYDPPALLFVRGTLSDDVPCIAVVGSRIASSYGILVTEKICRELAYKGIAVVSGMARGIDTAAHRGALSGRGKTVAVLGSGLDVVYPQENLKLSETIAGNGALVTEYPLGTPPHPRHFPARNRIISGLCRGVLVVEAGEKSGSLITARLALEQGRDVFAIPGAIDAPGSKGTHKLLKDGAKLVESVNDILDEILPALERQKQKAPITTVERRSEGKGKSEQAAKRSESSLTLDEQTVLSRFGKSPLATDDLIDLTGLSCQALQQTLTLLEIKGYLRKMPGAKYAVIS